MSFYTSDHVLVLHCVNYLNRVSFSNIITYYHIAWGEECCLLDQPRAFCYCGVAYFWCHMSYIAVLMSSISVKCLSIVSFISLRG